MHALRMRAEADVTVMSAIDTLLKLSDGMQQ